MPKQILLCLFSITFAAASPQGGHDHGGKAPSGIRDMGDILKNTFSALMNPLPLYKITQTQKPEFTVPGAIREQLYYGPLVLKPAGEKAKGKQSAMQMDPSGNVFMQRIVNITRDVTLLKSRTSIRDASGNELGISQGIYNHHISIPNMNRPAKALLACPKKGMTADMPVNSFAGVGEDGGKKTFNAAEGPETTGYYLGAKDNIMFAAEIINNDNAPKEVYVVLDLDYLKGTPPVTSTWHVLGVGTCDGQGIAIKPETGKNKFSIKSQPMTVQRAGYIFGLRGHVHDGGVGVTMTNNGKLICSSQATYGGKNEVSGDWATISEMGSCADRVPIPVNKGDVITLEASYDFDLHPARRHANGMMAEAMGILMFTFAEGKAK